MNYKNYSDEELQRYAWLRGTEWPSLPGYIMMGIGAFFLLFVKYWPLIITVLIINILWSLASRSFYNHALSAAGMWANKLKWVSAPGVSVYGLLHHNTMLAVAAITWPFVCMLVAVIGFGGGQGTNQARVLRSLMSGAFKKSKE